MLCTHTFSFVRAKTYEKNFNLCSFTGALVVPIPAIPAPTIHAPATRAKKEGNKANEQSKEAVQKSNRTSKMPTLQHFIVCGVFFLGRGEFKALGQTTRPLTVIFLVLTIRAQLDRKTSCHLMVQEKQHD